MRLRHITSTLIVTLVGWSFLLGHEIGDATRSALQEAGETRRIREQVAETTAAWRTWYFDMTYSSVALREDAANACIYADRFGDVTKLCHRFIDDPAWNSWASTIVQLAGEGKSYQCIPYNP